MLIQSLLCADIDECTEDLDDCSVNADCTNTIGSFVCTCLSGYTGDGRTCTGKSYCDPLTVLMFAVMDSHKPIIGLMVGANYNTVVTVP